METLKIHHQKTPLLLSRSARTAHHHHLLKTVLTGMVLTARHLRTMPLLLTSVMT
jgi:hypothetical protein